MLIGIPKEVKNNENRVGLTPASVRALVKQGHQVRVQQSAGLGSGFNDDEYRAAGADLVEGADVAWSAEMVVKVKEPVASEYAFLRPGLLLFTYLHLASDRALTEALLNSACTGIAYETVQSEDGALPLLMPMSEVAGRLATQAGATYLQKTYGGRGVLLGGVPGVAPANVAVLGAGIVGCNAARIAVGMGAQVTVLDIKHERLKALDDLYQGRIQTRFSHAAALEDVLIESDLIIGAVLIPGGRAPWLVTREILPALRPGAVIVDVAVDQGGCVETTRPTTHSDPIYLVDGIVHYCVANMPGAVPRTSTLALNNQTLPYVLKLAKQGLDGLKQDSSLLKGLNTVDGKLTYQAVAEAHGLNYTTPEQALTI